MIPKNVLYGQYAIKEFIGGGSFGDVYIGIFYIS